MIDLILILILAIPIGLAARYVCKAKKRGVHCIGCPDGATCGGRCQGGTTSTGSNQDRCCGSGSDPK